ncbi:hypothetical protein [Halobacteriovorax sp. JY17]|nr:hypothetical protein [Halobacteriovorax sp. JY17]
MKKRIQKFKGVEDYKLVKVSNDIENLVNSKSHIFKKEKFRYFVGLNKTG